MIHPGRLLLFLASIGLCSCTDSPAPPVAESRAVFNSKLAVNDEAPSHERWDALLRKHVSTDGMVDYAALHRDPARLNDYLQTLARNSPADSWTRSERLAYWINAYNAFTIKLILDNWPVRSIRDLDNPWKQRFIRLGDERYSLDQIEHEIIRPRFEEPRIHFALVCAAASCPPLLNRAFTADRLDEQLDERARSFINDEEFNVTGEMVVRVSPIFKWYADDFGDLRRYLNDYLEQDIPAGASINYLDYDWSLNDQ